MTPGAGVVYPRIISRTVRHGALCCKGSSSGEAWTGRNYPFMLLLFELVIKGARRIPEPGKALGFFAAADGEERL